MKKVLALILSAFFVLVIAAPVFAYGLIHEPEYRMDGIIDYNKQVGHECNTGAVMKQLIEGEGEMTKKSEIELKKGYIEVKDHQDWITAEEAFQNLAVTSVIELCAPAKHVYGAEGDDHEGMTVPVEWLYGARAAPGETIDVNGLSFAPDHFEALTDQVWAAYVEAEPFFNAGLEQNFEAAYGPFAQHHGEQALGVIPPKAPQHWWFIDAEEEPVLDPHENFREIVGTDAGSYYVGNFFDLYQFARTYDGVLKRYIDISSPWSGAYLHEDMSVIGEAEIFEPFVLYNQVPGEDAFPEWWEELF